MVDGIDTETDGVELSLSRQFERKLHYEVSSADRAIKSVPQRGSVGSTIAGGTSKLEEEIDEIEPDREVPDSSSHCHTWHDCHLRPNQALHDGFEVWSKRRDWKRHLYHAGKDALRF